ncbi:hypothetical protein [Duganella sp. HH101]|uniref:hypothetical protein n=1 Tax=Duganella sp. HH101 TaxID=1781066 RepID=UPI000893E654|nr:hypothetical protein [Duganella sp. HH101]OFA04345.1 hypothetical protein DUGA2_26190 [Duganella sp. HH101]
MPSQHTPNDFPAALIPGPRWIWVALFVLATSVAMLQSRPRQAPDCDDPGVALALRGAMQNDLLARALITGSAGSLDGAPQVKSVAELAYARRRGVRACKGKLSIAGGERPMAFTIHLDKTSDRGYYLAGAAPAVLAAGYSRLDREGRFADYVGPIGRARLKQAFLDGVLRLRHGGPHNSAEIGEVVAASACRPARGSTVLICRLLVERNDAALAQAGRDPHTLLDSEFTFERDPRSGNWRTAGGFGDEFGKAVDAAHTLAREK